MSVGVVFAATLVVFLLVIGAMAVGVMAGRREISGSCGGLASRTNADGETACSLCSRPSADCQGPDASESGQSAGTPMREEGDDTATECQKDGVTEGCSQVEVEACKRG
jgi:hypothetical protein